MKLQGLEALYWVAYSTSRADGESAARAYGVTLCSMLTMFPAAAALQFNHNLAESPYLLLISLVFSLFAVAIVIDKRRDAISRRFSVYGTQLRHRIIWVAYQSAAAIAIAGLSKAAPAFCLLTFLIFILIPVGWAFKAAE